ncbi:MAG: transposase [Anaerolineae bacterium]|nr:transposase [Anaerolineae bacterium]
MTQYRGYRVESTRLKNWPYTAGSYFVTICSHKRKRDFGFIEDFQMNLSEIGKLADIAWAEIPRHHPHVELDTWIVMPDHVHGILHIHINNERPDLRPDSGNGAQTSNEFGPLLKGSLQAIMNSYKGAITRQCGKNGHSDFRWQARFWDRLIRNERELIAAREYIMANPAKWFENAAMTSGIWM